MMRIAICFVSLVAAGGCLRNTAYQCETDAQCGANGHCEVSYGGYCSRDEASCSGGRIFSDTAGPYAGQCVGDQPPPDAAVDAKGDGAMSDAFTRCADNYQPIEGGEPGHQYRFVAALNESPETWEEMADNCRDDAGPAYRSYLAIPGTQAEGDAMVTFAANNHIWIGVNDKTTEGMYVTELDNAPYSPLPIPFDTGEGVTDNDHDCLGIRATTKKLFDERCDNGGTKFKAVCECQPK